MQRPQYIQHQISNLLVVSKIITVHYHEFTRDYGFEGEIHDFWELVYVDRGRVVVTAGDRRHNLGQGECVFHEPNEFHAIAADGQRPSNVFIITFVCRSAAMSYFRGRRMTLDSQLRALVANIMREAGATFDIARFNPGMTELKLRPDAPVGGQQMVRLYLEQLLIAVIRQDEGKREDFAVFPSRQTMENNIAARIIRILEEHLYSELTMEGLCAEMNYGKTTLCTAFRNATGQGIMQYYTTLRIARAKLLIREGEFNMTQISNRLCFDNPHYFSRAFKRVTGMSPREYARSLRPD